MNLEGANLIYGIREYISWTQYINNGLNENKKRTHIWNSYILAYDMSFCPLLNKLEWSDYISPRVDANSTRWKFKCGWWISTRLHNEMEAREDCGYHKCGICNNTSHNRETCHSRIHVVCATCLEDLKYHK